LRDVKLIRVATGGVPCSALPAPRAVMREYL